MAEIKVRRANKVLRVDEAQKKKYLDLGYDVIENGKVVEHNTKSVTPAEYKALLERCEALEKENAALRRKKTT